MTALKNWKEKYDDWLERLEEKIKVLSGSSIEEQDLKDKPSGIEFILPTNSSFFCCAFGLIF